MELSKTIGSMAVVLGVVVAAGFAVGEDNIPAPTPKTTTLQHKVDAREAQRRVAVEEQQKRKEHFERVCGKPMKTEIDRQACRAAYKALAL